MKALTMQPSCCLICSGYLVCADQNMICKQITRKIPAYNQTHLSHRSCKYILDYYGLQEEDEQKLVYLC